MEPTARAGTANSFLVGLSLRYASAIARCMSGSSHAHPSIVSTSAGSVGVVMLSQLSRAGSREFSTESSIRARVPVSRTQPSRPAARMPSDPLCPQFEYLAHQGRRVIACLLRGVCLLSEVTRDPPEFVFAHFFGGEVDQRRVDAIDQRVKHRALFEQVVCERQVLLLKRSLDSLHQHKKRPANSFARLLSRYRDR